MEDTNINHDNTGFILVKRETVATLIKKNYQLANMVLLLEYICELRKIKMTLSAEECCELLKIKPEELERCREKKWIRSVPAGDRYIYKAFEIAKIAERLNRRKVLHKLSRIPNYTR